MTAFAPMVGYVLRTARPRHWWVALLPTVLAVLLALLARQGDGSPEHDFVTVVGTAVCTVVLPLTCLVLADSALGAELRSGTFALTWMSPVPVWQIVLARWVGALLLVGGALLPAVAVGALVAGAPGALLPVLVSVTLGAAAYLGVFMLLGAVFRRALALSLGYVVIVEGFLGSALASIASITPGWLSVGLLSGWAGAPRGRDLPEDAAATARLVVLTALGLVLTMRKAARPRAASGDE